MKRLTLAAVGGVLAAVLGVPALVTQALAADVTQARLENADAEPNNWLHPFQNYDSHRFSRLAQINRDNVANLKMAFAVPITTGLVGRTSNFQQHALVDGGFMYFDDGGGMIYKVDVRDGNRAKIVWKANGAVATGSSNRTRGIAMGGNSVFHNLTDGRVIAVDRDSGEFVWDKQIARIPHPKGALNPELENFTAAPMVIEGKVLVGQSNGDAGTRGWLAAINMATGAEVWRTYTVPGPGEPGHETWKDDHNAWKTGGAALWTTGSYDKAQRLTIWGTGQPVPMFDPEFRPGDNLFSNSAVAFEIDTGKMKWYYQYTPNESWDYDEQGVHMLYDTVINGQPRKVIGHWARNGYYYQLDRNTGDFINATQFVDKITWTAGLDPKTGKPIEYDPNLALQTYVPATRWLRGEANAEVANQSCPTKHGGVRWQPPAYNPVTQVAYVAATDGCFSLRVMATVPIAADGGMRNDQGGGANGRGNNPENYFDRHGTIAAIDVKTNKVIARIRTPHENLSGALATAGGLIFTGNLDGTVSAYHDTTLAELWRFDTGISYKAPPISYGVGNKQYIAIIAGGGVPSAQYYPDLAQMNTGAMLYVFGL